MESLTSTVPVFSGAGDTTIGITIAEASLDWDPFGDGGYDEALEGEDIFSWTHYPNFEFLPHEDAAPFSSIFIEDTAQLWNSSQWYTFYRTSFDDNIEDYKSCYSSDEFFSCDSAESDDSDEEFHNAISETRRIMMKFDRFALKVDLTVVKEGHETKIEVKSKKSPKYQTNNKSCGTQVEFEYDSEIEDPDFLLKHDRQTIDDDDEDDDDGDEDDDGDDDEDTQESSINTDSEWEIISLDEVKESMEYEFEGLSETSPENQTRNTSRDNQVELEGCDSEFNTANYSLGCAGQTENKIRYMYQETKTSNEHEKVESEVENSSSSSTLSSVSSSVCDNQALQQLFDHWDNTANVYKNYHLVEVSEDDEDDTLEFEESHFIVLSPGNEVEIEDDYFDDPCVVYRSRFDRYRTREHVESQKQVPDSAIHQESNKYSCPEVQEENVNEEESVDTSIKYYKGSHVIDDKTPDSKKPQEGESVHMKLDEKGQYVKGVQSFDVEGNGNKDNNQATMGQESRRIIYSAEHSMNTGNYTEQIITRKPNALDNVIYSSSFEVLPDDANFEKRTQVENISEFGIWSDLRKTWDETKHLFEEDSGTSSSENGSNTSDYSTDEEELCKAIRTLYFENKSPDRNIEPKTVSPTNNKKAPKEEPKGRLVDNNQQAMATKTSEIQYYGDDEESDFYEEKKLSGTRDKTHKDQLRKQLQQPEPYGDATGRKQLIPDSKPHIQGHNSFDRITTDFTKEKIPSSRSMDLKIEESQQFHTKAYSKSSSECLASDSGSWMELNVVSGPEPGCENADSVDGYENTKYTALKTCSKSDYQMANNRRVSLSELHLLHRSTISADDRFSLNLQAMLRELKHCGVKSRRYRVLWQKVKEVIEIHVATFDSTKIGNEARRQLYKSIFPDVRVRNLKGSNSQEKLRVNLKNGEFDADRIRRMMFLIALQKLFERTNREYQEMQNPHQTPIIRQSCYQTMENFFLHDKNSFAMLKTDVNGVDHGCNVYGCKIVQAGFEGKKDASEENFSENSLGKDAQHCTCFSEACRVEKEDLTNTQMDQPNDKEELNSLETNISRPNGPLSSGSEESVFEDCDDNVLDKISHTNISNNEYLPKTATITDTKDTTGADNKAQTSVLSERLDARKIGTSEQCKQSYKEETTIKKEIVIRQTEDGHYTENKEIGEEYPIGNISVQGDFVSNQNGYKLEHEISNDHTSAGLTEGEPIGSSSRSSVEWAELNGNQGFNGSASMRNRDPKTSQQKSSIAQEKHEKAREKIKQDEESFVELENGIKALRQRFTKQERNIDTLAKMDLSESVVSPVTSQRTENQHHSVYSDSEQDAHTRRSSQQYQKEKASEKTTVSGSDFKSDKLNGQTKYTKKQTNHEMRVPSTSQMLDGNETIGATAVNRDYSFDRLAETVTHDSEVKDDVLSDKSFDSLVDRIGRDQSCSSLLSETGADQSKKNHRQLHYQNHLHESLECIGSIMDRRTALANIQPYSKKQDNPSYENLGISVNTISKKYTSADIDAHPDTNMVRSYQNMTVDVNDLANRYARAKTEQSSDADRVRSFQNLGIDFNEIVSHYTPYEIDRMQNIVKVHSYQNMGINVNDLSKKYTQAADSKKGMPTVEKVGSYLNMGVRVNELALRYKDAINENVQAHCQQGGDIQQATTPGFQVQGNSVNEKDGDSASDSEWEIKEEAGKSDFGSEWDIKEEAIKAQHDSELGVKNQAFNPHLPETERLVRVGDRRRKAKSPRTNQRQTLASQYRKKGEMNIDKKQYVHNINRFEGKRVTSLITAFNSVEDEVKNFLPERKPKGAKQKKVLTTPRGCS